ncbi:general transcription factor IIH subunit 3 isoform 2-T2 [Lycaon pictus]
MAPSGSHSPRGPGQPALLERVPPPRGLAATGTASTQRVSALHFRRPGAGALGTARGLRQAAVASLGCAGSRGVRDPGGPFDGSLPLRWGILAAMVSDEDELNLLVIVVDTNPIWWGKQALKESQFTLSKCIDAVMVLGNSHLFMNRSNKLAVIASHIQESRFLYPGKNGKLGDFFGDPGNPSEFSPSGSKDGKYELFTAANEVIVEEIKDLMIKSDIEGQHTETLLAGSLAKALCYIHRMNKEVKDNQEMKSRILVIKAAEDSALQYMNFMNVIFAAQKQNILIDACVLDSDSGLLQQWVFLPDQDQRSQLILPPPIHVDYRAACFCHRNLIEIGYVCSVCLSSKLEVQSFLCWGWRWQKISQLCGFSFHHSVCFVFQIYSILQLQSHLHNVRVSIPEAVWLACVGEIQGSERCVPFCVVTGQPLRFLCLRCSRPRKRN